VTIAPGAYVCEERLQLVGEISIGMKFEIFGKIIFDNDF
jgi:hypothetical protein